MTSDQSELKFRCAAYHEAGHIVAAAVGGLKLKRERELVWINSDGCGCSRYIGGPCLANADRAWYDCHSKQGIVSLHAGFIAQEQFHLDCPKNSATQDSRDIDCHLKGLFGSADSEEAVEKSEEWKREAEQIVREHWYAIQELAEAICGQPCVTDDQHGLVKRLGWLQVQEVLEKCKIDACWFGAMD